MENSVPKHAEADVGHQPEPSSLPKRKRSSAAAAAGGDERLDSEIADGEKQLLVSDPTVLDCSICKDSLTLPVFECENGHIICSSCQKSCKQKCPSCSSEETGNIHRCWAIESVLESVQVPCFYISYGCPEQFSYSSKRSHEAACPYAPFRCPSTGCTFVGCERRITLHVTEQHPNSVKTIYLEDKRRFSVSVNDKFYVCREEYHGTLFFLNLYERMSLTCIEAGPKHSVGEDFAYVIILRGKDSCLRFQSRTNPFEKTPMGKRCGISKDFVTVPPSSFARDQCSKKC